MIKRPPLAEKPAKDEDRAPLESVLRTDELKRRPERLPDYRTESRAQTELVQALADAPGGILEKLAGTILAVCKADSAGISLLMKDETTFYWAAIAGAWKPHIGGGTPRNFGPSGDALDRDSALLFTHPERRYPQFLAALPLIEEGLVVPIYVNGKAVGTLWAIIHDSSPVARTFDSEDLRQLESLGRFAAAAHQTLAFRDELKHQKGAAQSGKELATLSEGLLESENRYRSLFNSIDEGFCIIEMIFDAQNKPVDFLFLSVNPSFENQTGMRFAAGKRMRELVPDLEDHWFDIYGKVALTGEPIRYINEAKAMRSRWFDVYAFKTGAPGSYQVAVLFNEISGRKNAEAALIESEQRYRNLFNSMDEGFCIIKIIFDDDQKPVDYRFLEVNSSFERQSGIKNARGKLISEFVPNLDPQWYERYGRVALTGEPFRIVEDIRGMDRRLDITAHRLGGPQDRTVAVVFNDLSDQKRAKELDLAIHTRTRELAFAKNELQEVCDTVRESLVVLDSDLRVVHANRSFYETFGLTKAEVKSQSFLALGKGEWDAERLKSLRRALSKARKFDNFELGRVFEKSAPKIFRFTGRLISTEGATRLMLAIEDVTLRKQAEEAESLRRSEALQREFVANVSHELRTPLASVLGYAETLRKGGLSDVKNRMKFVRVIEKQGHRLMHLVQNLLELASLESGRGRSKYEPILLRPFVLQLLSVAPRAARRQGIKIQIGIPEELVAVVDKGQFAQVVQNLCDNAIKYNRKNGRVVIDASNSTKETILSVKDTGIGISREDMPHIFDRFHRAVCHAGSRTGSGLGLAIAKNIIESHGGRIWAESEEGKGSAFFVALPAQLDIPL